MHVHETTTSSCSQHTCVPLIHILQHARVDLFNAPSMCMKGTVDAVASTYHTASQSPSLIKADDADICRCLELVIVEHMYALLLQRVSTGSIAADNDSGHSNGHCCNDGTEYSCHNLSGGNLICVEVWHG